MVNFIQKSRRVVKYKSYEEAYAQCSSNAYQDEELCNMIADKTLAYIETLKVKPLLLKPSTVYLAFALNYVANTSGKKNISILDFGGACGAHYYEARNMVPDDIGLNWIVVETEQMTRSAISRGHAKGELSFVNRIEDVKGPIDFVHSSSTVQYVPAPYMFLQNLVDCNAKMMLFNRMMFNKNNADIITVQRSLLSANGPGKLPAGYSDRQVSYPHTVMAISKMYSTMQNGGYECLAEFDESSGTISLGNEQILGKGLLFVKKA